MLFFRACGGPPLKVIISEESRRAENPPLVKDQIEDKGGFFAPVGTDVHLTVYFFDESGFGSKVTRFW